MKLTWIGAAAAAVVVAASLAAGCYATAEVPQGKIAAVSRPLSAPTKIGGSRLGPASEIRARLEDGSVTRWIPAGDLAVTPHGLVNGRGRTLVGATEATISGAGDGAKEMLAATTPPGGRVNRTREGWLVLRVSDSRVLLPWLAAYASGARALGQRIGWVSFQGRGASWTTDWMQGAFFAESPPASFADLRATRGLSWEDVSALEVHNVEPIRTSFAILGAPLAMAGMMLSMVGTVAAVADGKDPTPAINLGVTTAELTAAAMDSADAAAGTGDAPRRRDLPPMLVSAGETSDTLAATPLFSEAARRRETIKLLVAVEGGITSEGAGTGALGLGIRLGDYVELSARARALPYDDRPAWMNLDIATSSIQFLYGGRAALHIDGDGDRRLAGVFGAELLGGSMPDGTSLTQGSLILGPRFGLTSKTFASLLFAPSFVSTSGSPYGDQTIGQVMFSAELGFDL